MNGTFEKWQSRLLDGHLSEDRFLTIVRAGKNDQHLTFAEFDRMITSFAHRLSEKFARDSTGSPVTLRAKNDLASVLAIMALIRMNIDFINLDPQLPEWQLFHFMESLSSKLVINTDEEIYRGKNNLNLGKAVSSFQEAIPLSSEYKEIRRVASKLTSKIMFQTSGSTGLSKLVVQNTDNLVHNAIAISDRIGLRKGEKLLGCLPIHHVNGFHLSIMACYLSQAQLILVENGFSIFNYLDILDTYKPSYASVVPAILVSIQGCLKGRKLPRELKHFITAASPLANETFAFYYEQQSVLLLQGYGLSETTNFATMTPPSIDPADLRQFYLNKELPPSIGVCVKNCDIKIISEVGEVLDEGQVGELVIQGSNVAEAYIGYDTNEFYPFAEKGFYTGDLGFFLCNSKGDRYFFISGRKKNVAKIGGESISLEEIEAHALKVPGVGDVACSFQTSHLGDEVVVFYQSSDSDLKIDIKSQLSKYIPKRLIPKRYIKIDKIPRNPTGKIRRSDLRKHLDKEIKPDETSDGSPIESSTPF